MTTRTQLSPPNDSEEALSKLSRRRHHIFGKDRHSSRHCDLVVAAGLVLDIGQERRPNGVGDPVEGDPGEDLIARKRRSNCPSQSSSQQARGGTRGPLPFPTLGLPRLTAIGCSAIAPEDRPEPHPALRSVDLTWHPASHSALTVLDCSLRSRRIALWDRAAVKDGRPVGVGDNSKHAAARDAASRADAVQGGPAHPGGRL